MSPEPSPGVRGQVDWLAVEDLEGGVSGETVELGACESPTNMASTWVTSALLGLGIQGFRAPPRTSGSYESSR